MNKTPAQEACVGCGTQSTQVYGDAHGSGQGQLMTYNEGKGIKDQIVLTGPLSAAVSAAMNWVFDKKPLDLAPEAPEQDMQAEHAALSQTEPAKAATESMAQDAYIEEMVASMGKTAELGVVLSDFDVKSVKDHLEEVALNGVPSDAPDITSVYVCDAETITQPDIYEGMIADGDRQIVLVVGDMGGVGPLQSPDTDLTSINEERADPTPVPDNVPKEVISEDSVASIESIFAGTNVKVCIGFEAFAKTLSDIKAKRVN